MSYLALYRKYRSTTFDEVVGQNHISQTLKNQILEGRIGHAYLFTGTRGTGKTSLAKIFAKAVNCENPQDGSPCGKCETCLALSRADNMDVIEIDAASNNGVDDLRDLREKAQFRPVKGKYKVYIIDEVHMLSISAFNALLKTLEEPPKHVIFILATTEVQKIPATILSRCMRFDFRLIPTDKIFAHIKKIYGEMGKEAEDEAIYQIARAGEGSMRDALSIADICLSVSNGKLTYDEVTEVIGNLKRESVEKLFSLITKNQTKEMLELLSELIENGKSVQLISKDLYQFVRDLLVLKLTKEEFNLNLPAEVLERMKKISEEVDESYLLNALNILEALEPKFKTAINMRILLETTLLRMSTAKNDNSLSSLTRRIALLEKSLENGVVRPQRVAEKVAFIQKTPEVIAEEQKREEQQAEISREEQDERYAEEELSKLSNKGKLKGKLLRFLRENGEQALFSAINLTDITENGTSAVIEVTNSEDKAYLLKKNNFDLLNKLFHEMGYTELTISVVVDHGQIQKQQIIDNAKELVGDILKIK